MAPETEMLVKGATEIVEPEKLAQGVPKSVEAVETPTRRVGVLLVHGIGNQKRTHTLTQFGEPLFLCLQQWLKGHFGDAELDQVVVREDSSRAESPACAQIHLSCRREPEAPLVNAQWRLAESNWADVFEQPSFRNVAIWSCGAIPWLMLTQFGDRLSEHLRHHRWLRAWFSFCYLVVTFPLSLLLQVVVLALVPVSLIPPMRPLVAPIHRWIAGVIGDTYVLLTSPLQFQSMVSQVRADLKWLAEEGKCDVLTVVAHSQGAAVAHEALRQSKDLPVERFITFGSAITRLKAFRFVLRSTPGMLRASSLLSFPILLLTGLYLWNLLSVDRLVYTVSGVWVIGLILALSAYVMPFTVKRINELCSDCQQFALNPAIVWEDYYASSDPIPNGAMFASQRYAIKSIEVHNHANIFTDHSTYWSNQDQFCSSVMGSLLQVTGGSFAGVHKAYAWDIATVNTQRRRRLHWLVAARLTAIAVLTTAIFTPAMFDLGLPVPHWLQVPLDWFTLVANWSLESGHQLLSSLGEKLNLAKYRLLKPKLISAQAISWPVACVLFAALWYGFSCLLFKWWEKNHTAYYFEKPSNPITATTATSLDRPKWVWLGGFAIATVGWFVLWVAAHLVKPGDFGAEARTQADGFFEAFKSTLAFVVGAGYFVLATVAQSLRKLRQNNGAWTELYTTLVNALSHRAFRARPVAFLAAATAISSLFLILTQINVRTPQPDLRTLQAAFALIALSLGVYAWVTATDRVTRMAALLGLSLGPVVLPIAAAYDVSIHRTGHIWLQIGAGMSVVFAVAGAEFLRRAWQTIERRTRSDVQTPLTEVTRR